MAERHYQPIKDYAAIGDCHGAALVARDGDVDWCCLTRFDSDPLMLRLLDKKTGGFLSTGAAQTKVISRHYLPRSNVLQTVVVTATGRLHLTDFMPVGRAHDAGVHDYVHLVAPGWLVRQIDVVEGEIELTTVLRLSRDWAAQRAALAPGAAGFFGDANLGVRSDLALADTGGELHGQERLAVGQRRTIAIGADVQQVSATRLAQLLAVTLAFWREWIAYNRYDGAHIEAVCRSALLLKLLTYAPSGAITAAVTTSLPEEIGGERNWDYRHCWVRDAGMTLQALSALGYSGEGKQFYEFLNKTIMDGPEKLAVGYGPEMETDIPERTLTHLDGYRSSRPVRAGNGAFTQIQTDVYAYVMEGALTYHTLGGRVSKKERSRFAAIVDYVGTVWDKPDQGIWEARGGPRHYVHSKAMCWVAVDRGIRLLGARPEWLVLRERIMRSLLDHGVSAGRWRQAYGANDLDAALLLLSSFGMPEAQAPLMAQTVVAIEQRLRQDDYVFRYRGDDGISGSEGGFLACSFWLVEALLMAGRQEEAEALFGRLLLQANDAGLYAEEADPASGAFLGNFPQALTHLALVSSALRLALAKKQGLGALRGAGADRVRRLTGATIGWRGVIAGLLRHPSSFKLFSSRRSRYPA